MKKAGGMTQGGFHNKLPTPAVVKRPDPSFDNSGIGGQKSVTK